MTSPVASFTRFSNELERASENELSRRYLKIVERWIPHGLAAFESWPHRPRAGHFFGGVLWYCQETVMPAFALAAAASSTEFDESLAGADRDRVRETAFQAMRYACFTHDTGPADCVRPSESWGRREPAGSKWGERGRGFFRETNAGRQVGNLAGIACFLRDLLGDEEREMLANVASDYLDRFIDYTPPSGLFYDTQMEENAWTAFGLAGAAFLLDSSDQFTRWSERLEEWMFHATTTPDDMHDLRQGPNGKSVRDATERRFTTLPDFTAENHGFLHPSYMKSCLNLLGQMRVLYMMWGKGIPEVSIHHHTDIYSVVASWCDDNGIPHAPQGMDWPYINFTGQCFTHAVAAESLDLADAAHLEVKALEALERVSIIHDGQVVPTQTKKYCHGQQDPAVMKERFISHTAYTYLLKRLAGSGPAPSSADEFDARRQGVRVYPHGGTALHVHPRGRTSISWRNGSMILPATRKGLEYIGQSRSTILASFNVEGRAQNASLVFSNVRNGADRVAAAFEELLWENTVRRRVVSASFPDGRCFTWEVVTANEDVTINSLVQGRISVINDPVFASHKPPASRRLVRTSGAANEFNGFAGADETPTESMPLTHWVNVDGEFGIVFVGCVQATYTNPHSWPVWHAIEDWIDLGGFRTPRSFAKGDIIGTLALLWLPETDAETTAQHTVTLVESSGDRLYAKLAGAGREDVVCCTFADAPYQLPEAVHLGKDGCNELGTGICLQTDTTQKAQLTIPPREPVQILGA